ncbi:MAG: helix-turn-helix domain-containing protein [Methyloglobulus sp.]
MQNQTLILRPKAVCAKLGISNTTFWRLAKSGKLKVIKISPRLTGVRREDLTAYLDSQAA